MTSDVTSLAELSIKVFADGADLADIRKGLDDPVIVGFTTNPTLMRKAGISDYVAFAREAIEIVGDRPISFEVFADELDEMEAQAREISSWGGNVYVKIPVTTCDATSCAPLVKRLSSDGIQLNVTAVFSLGQVTDVVDALDPSVAAIVSVFAGRIADSGRDPVPLMAEALTIVRSRPAAELLWASPREVLNIVQADGVGCDIITVTPDLLAKAASFGKSLEAFSLETVEMFHRDAAAAGYDISVPAP